MLFVAAVCLGTASAEPASSPYSGPITAVGTEPFWRLSIDPASDTIWLNELEGAGYPVSPYASPVVGSDGSATFKAADFTVRLKMAGGCSDGMSDLSFPMEATVTAGSHTYRGCAYQRWDNDLLALLPQIDACLAAAKAKGPVSLATRTNAGVIVRLPADEGVFECAFRLDSVEPGSAGLLTDAVPMVSERDPLFFRAPGENPGGECFEAPEVRAADGSLVGWTMADEDC
jgi:uncharacterized membrane protein